MHITLAYVASINGKITKGDDPDVHEWSSVEDEAHFARLRDENEVIILDRKTYEVVQPTPEPGKLRIVFTSTPDRFKAVPGQLEFVNEAPAEVVKWLSSRGYKKILIAGGARLSSSFLAAGLVDDLYLSLEPVLFGSGRPMITKDIAEVSLKLQSFKQLNNQGTILAYYSVIKDKHN
jgi:dihydrofolate reductase